MCCFTYGESGHIQTACPNQGRRGFLATDATPDDEPVYDEILPSDSFDNDEIIGDTGPLLVLYRTCLAPPKKTEDWRRTSIFHSTCTIHGKICCFVIDSGSCANIISEEAVRKLALTTEVHPQPHRLAWMNDGIDVKVSRRALVGFFVGPIYKDEVYCDVANMNVSHLILGQPWEFDRGVSHDGINNTYSFTFQGHHLTLLPLADHTNTETPPIPAPNATQNLALTLKIALFATGKEF